VPEGHILNFELISPPSPVVPFSSIISALNQIALSGGENLTALLSKLVKVWTIRSGSAYSLADTGETDKVTPALSARERISSADWSIKLAASQVCFVIVTLPDSMRSISRMSLMSRIKRSLLLTAISSIR
jgi:hypothetical protein